MTAGISVSSLGHAHPALVRAISTQARRLIHASNLYYNEPNVLAADAIVRHSFADLTDDELAEALAQAEVQAATYTQ